MAQEGFFSHPLFWKQRFFVLCGGMKAGVGGLGVRAGYIRNNCAPGGNRPERVPVCRDAACGCSADRSVNGLFSLRTDNCFCAELRGPAGSCITTGVYRLRNNATTVLASSNRTTGFCSVFGVTSYNSRVIYSSSVCNKAFGLFSIAVTGVNVRFAFMAPSYDSDRLRTTFGPGAGTMFNRAVTAPTLAILSVREFTSTTRSRNMPLVVSGAFTAPVGYEPFR